MLIYRLKDPSRNASKTLILRFESIINNLHSLSACPGVSVFLFLPMSVISPEYLSVEDFPEHIKSLVQKEKESEEQEKRQREIERNTCKVHSLSGLTPFLLPFGS